MLLLRMPFEEKYNSGNQHLGLPVHAITISYQQKQICFDRLSCVECQLIATRLQVKNVKIMIEQTAWIDSDLVFPTNNNSSSDLVVI